jgi:hypothetical protein
MGKAIDSLYQVEEKESHEDGESTALPLEHQLILSYCWLNIKESSALLSSLVSPNFIVRSKDDSGKPLSYLLSFYFSIFCFNKM